jgi:CheY-like chemotaxis protein
VDDNEDAAEMLAMLIGTLGYQTRTAFDGATALTAVAEFDPGIALLDIGLPVMDGYELAGRVKRSVDHEIRLIAITGYGQERDRAASVAAGFDAHLVKPVSISELTAILEQFEEDLVTD